ncbi:unnamed protein product [Boreogadus saida]
MQIAAFRHRFETILPPYSNGAEVPDTRCAGEPSPPSLPCEVACPGDCVVAPWGPWTGCSHPCGPRRLDGRQSRTRSVLALAGQECSKHSTTGKVTPFGSGLDTMSSGCKESIVAL